MSHFLYALYDLRQMDELARKDTWIHNLHPLAKCLTTLVFVAVVASFPRYEVVGLFPFIIFPIIMAAAGDIPIRPIAKRLWLAEPFLIFIGLLNPLFDRSLISFGTLTVARGWLSLASMVVRGSLAVAAALVLTATTGLENIVSALRLLGLPRILAVQLWLAYRYLSLLIEETARAVNACRLRSGRPGLERKVWGPLLGRLLLRTIDRGERIYQAMRLRGGLPEWGRRAKRFGPADVAVTAFWILLFVLLRLVNLSELIGKFLTGI